jgi:hypothetical protein
MIFLLVVGGTIGCVRRFTSPETYKEASTGLAGVGLSEGKLVPPLVRMRASGSIKLGCCDMHLSRIWGRRIASPGQTRTRYVVAVGFVHRSPK